MTSIHVSYSSISPILFPISPKLIDDREKMLLFVYRPLIQLDPSEGRGEIHVFQHQGRIYSQITENGQTKILPIKGYPKMFVHSTECMQAFFACTHLTIEKDYSGVARYVNTHISLRGGMMGQQDMVPLHAGYDLGNLVRKSEIRLPELNQACLNLKGNIKVAELKKVRLNEDFENLKKTGVPITESMKDKHQSDVIKCNAEINSAKEVYEKARKEIESLEDNTYSESIHEALPIDYNETQIRTLKRNFKYDKMDHILIKKKDVESVRMRVERFVVGLFPQSMSLSCFPPNALEGIIDRAQEILNDESDIAIVGAVNILPRISVMDPIIFRHKAKVSSELRRQAGDFYVLTEAILGGVFLAIGKQFNRSENVDKKTETDASKSLLSNWSIVSFVSHGAIPKLNGNAASANLWNVYTQWKEDLINDDNSGYPLGFQYRELEEVLRENRM